MSKYSQLFKDGYVLNDTDLIIYILLQTKNYLSRDDIKDLNINNIDLKIKHINKGGKFLLTPDGNGWIIEK